jgi:hypothetical protein
MLGGQLIVKARNALLKFLKSLVNREVNVMALPIRHQYGLMTLRYHFHFLTGRIIDKGGGDVLDLVVETRQFADVFPDLLLHSFCHFHMTSADSYLHGSPTSLSA